MSLKKPCAYCGLPSDKRDKEHVFPRNLYPLSKAPSKVQRLTIPACNRCNNSWADDEVHFRNILVLAGDPITPARTELWNTKVDRSFSQIDGLKRLQDIVEQMKSVNISGQDRHMVYPGNDPRVIRVMRKIVRGLSYYHNISRPLSENRIFVDVLKYEVPENIFNAMEFNHRDKDIVEYGFQVLNENDIQSVWIIRFFQTVPFIAIVSSGNETFET
jgi:hypothetical protein